MSDRPAVRDTWASGHPAESLASYVLDVLDAEEAAAVEAHVAGCEACAGEVEQLRSVVDTLPLAVQPVAPPPGGLDALLHRIRADEPAAPRPLRRAPSFTRSPRAGWLAAAACLALALVSGVQLRVSQQRVVEVQAANDELARAAREESLVLASLDPGSTRLVPLSGTGATPEARGRIMYDAQARRAIVVLERLPPLDPGKTYQLWLLPAGAAPPLSAGTWGAEEDAPGSPGSVVIQAPAELPTFAGLGVTLEPAPGSVAPTGPLVLAGTF
jgi:anti-sigma-K factor RskA